jgi:hypothetical protein
MTGDAPDKFNRFRRRPDYPPCLNAAYRLFVFSVTGKYVFAVSMRKI